MLASEKRSVSLFRLSEAAKVTADVCALLRPLPFPPPLRQRLSCLHHQPPSHRPSILHSQPFAVPSYLVIFLPVAWTVVFGADVAGEQTRAVNRELRRARRCRCAAQSFTELALRRRVNAQFCVVAGQHQTRRNECVHFQ